MTNKQIMDEKAVKESLEKMARQILSENTNLKNLVLVGIITRGFNLAERISNLIAVEYNIEVNIGALDTRPYRDDIKYELNEDHSNIPFNLTGRDVILVDDVMSTGRTIRAALEALMQHGRPKSIKTAVLIDRGHREVPISADYVGLEIPTSVKEQIRLKLKEVDGGKDGAFIVPQ